MFISPPARRGAVLAGALLAGILAACHEVTAPPRREFPPPGQAARDAGIGNATTLTFSVTANDTNGGGSYAIPDSVQFRHYSYVHVTASGTITKTPVYDWLYTAQTFGPEWAYIDRGNGYGATYIGTSGVDLMIVPRGPVGVGTPAHDPGHYDWDNYHSPDHLGITCGPGPTYPTLCNHYSGSLTFSITPYSSDLLLTADSSVYTPGSTATFGLVLSAPTINGVTIPYAADSSWWIPEDSGETPVAGPGLTAFTNLTGGYHRTVAGSGTLSVSGWPNGVWQKKSVHISAASLSLEAVKQYGGANRSVTFTPAWSNGAPTVGATWSWPADSGTAQTVACNTGTAPCVTTVMESGTMTVSITRSGVTRTAKIHVYTVPCPTSDDLLNTPELRLGLSTIDIMSRQGNPAYRKEQGGYLFRNHVTGEYKFLLSFTNYADACSWNDQPWPASPGPDWDPAARTHSHPYNPLTDTLPRGTVCKKKNLSQNSVPSWGPSPADDGVVIDGYPSFVIDADSIYRTDGPNQHSSWAVNGQCQLLPPVVLNRVPSGGVSLPSSIVRRSKSGTADSSHLPIQ